LCQALKQLNQAISGLLAAGRRNKSLNVRAWLKVNHNVLIDTIC